jgi:hypothetical protein
MDDPHDPASGCFDNTSLQGIHVRPGDTSDGSMFEQQELNWFETL